VVLTVAVTIAVLGVLILVHELGHYLAARVFDIRVPRFSIGFGPRLAGVTRGETEFRIGLLPLGGYVKLAGMDDMSGLEGPDEPEAPTDPERSFASKPVAARAVVLAAGVTMNAVLAVLLFAAVAFVWGAPQPSDPVVADVAEEWLPESAAALAGIEPGSRITRVGGRRVATMDDVSRRLMRASHGDITLEFANRPPLTVRIPEEARERRLIPVALSPVHPMPAIVGSVVTGGPADAAGLKPGDRVTAVDGERVSDWQVLARIAETHPGQAINLTVQRGDALEELSVTPARVTTAVGVVGRIQAGPDPRAASRVSRQRLAVGGALRWGATESWRVIVLTGDFFVGLLQGRYSPFDIGGPLLIAELSGSAARAGAPVLLFFVALLSVNLAVINLLPIPALDGGHLVVLAVETVRGRPPSPDTRRLLGRLGVTLVVVIMLWAVAADVLRLVGA
jgi:regulator of sigma E protease